MMHTYGIIGAGQMGSAMARALCRSIGADRLYLSNRSPQKAAALAAELGAHAVTNADAARCRFVLLAVKPQAMAALFEELRPILCARTDRFVLVSVAAGLDIAALQAMAGAEVPIVRVMPNTPVRIGRGMCLYCASAQVQPEELAQFLADASAAGCFDAIDEAQMNACSAVAGCSPAFVSLFLEALADGGVACGLPRGKALLYAAQAIAGTAELYLATGDHPGEMKDAVCSPGGSTIAGVRALERGGFRSAVIEAVAASTARGYELGQKK